MNVAGGAAARSCRAGLRHLDIEFTIDGAGIEREHAERAIQLSFERYCSVASSLAPDIVAETADAQRRELRSDAARILDAAILSLTRRRAGLGSSRCTTGCGRSPASAA